MNRTLALLSAATLLAAACAENQKKDTNTPASSGAGAPQPAQQQASRCDTSGKNVVEADLNGDKKTDVWKVYHTVVENGAKVDVLECKEVDLNFDGKKDIWVFYDEQGNIREEQFDLDFDGKIDMWTYRQNGKIVRQELDVDFDGKPDVWKYYENEKLARIERSSHKNGRVDVWEYYEGGKLDRIGYDTTGSGVVDRWDKAPEDAAPVVQPTQPASNPSGGPAAAVEQKPQPAVVNQGSTGEAQKADDTAAPAQPDSSKKKKSK